MEDAAKNNTKRLFMKLFCYAWLGSSGLADSSVGIIV